MHFSLHDGGVSWDGFLNTYRMGHRPRWCRILALEICYDGVNEAASSDIESEWKALKD